MTVKIIRFNNDILLTEGELQLLLTNIDPYSSITSCMLLLNSGNDG